MDQDSNGYMLQRPSSKFLDGACMHRIILIGFNQITQHSVAFCYTALRAYIEIILKIPATNLHPFVVSVTAP